MNSKIENRSAEAANLDEIVFEGRNREYGAYVLRKGYARSMVVGTIITILIVTAVVFLPSVVEYFSAGNAPVTAPPRKLVYAELTAPPPIDKPKPPPPAVQLPRLQKVIKFVPPKVVREAVVETVPTIEEIKENETAAVAIEGAEVVFEEPVVEVTQADDNEIFTFVEQQPEFMGGYEAMINFVKTNMRYPASARRLGIDGTVHVSFVVAKTGEISEVKVLRGITADCDSEALRVISMMPPWKPGRQNGRPVYVRMVVPLKFNLN